MGNQSWFADGVAYLKGAMASAEIFVSEAPPDSIRMSVMLQWLVVLRFVLRGNTITKSLKELDVSYSSFSTPRC